MTMDRATNDNSSLRQSLAASLAATPPRSSLALADEIGRRYDGAVPAEARAAIAAARQAERDAKLTAGMTEADRLRFFAAKEWRLLKGEFRTLCQMVKRGTFKRSDACFRQLQKSARDRARPRIEVWAVLRHVERRAVWKAGE